MQVSLLSTVMWCFTLSTSALFLTQGKNVKIFRAERDRFTNVARCNETSAVCFDENCNYCQCMMNQTYIQMRGQYGECVSNEHVAYATAYKSSFLIVSNLHSKCIYQRPYKYYTFVRNDICNNNNSNYRWIWTSHGQLLNWATLECATDDFYSKEKNYHLIMKRCDRGNQKQLWKCVGEKKYDMQSMTGRYIYYGYFTLMGKNQTQKTELKRFGSQNDVCSQGVTRCDTFVDGSSLVILNKTKCEEKESECIGTKTVSLEEMKCFFLPNRTQYLHNETWQSLEIKNSSLRITSTEDKVHLKWNLKKTPQYLEGLMVKVTFTCENTSTNAGTIEHCIVIKYTGTFTGFYDEVEDNGDNSNEGNENSDKSDPDNDKEYNATTEDKTNGQTIIIIVCVLVVLILAGIIMFVVYRYRHRCVRPAREKTEGNAAEPTPTEEDADALNPLYPANNNQMAQRECDLYEPTPDHLYQYVDVENKTADPPLQNLTYDYAVVDGPINQNVPQKTELDEIQMEAVTESNDEKRIGDGEEEMKETKDTVRSTKPPPHKYHVLEGP
ncbi:uncharacterized protein LOC114533460 [Dendronephthya gigantea]|uniref:uncharacterized protein LOC114533460 n=1 Tax=Dendronephthya gigantea TaxID=151771 RepID=UPI00106BE7E8|nr:uncharacterized protein LOC114533460 [Dendronephthya gigantea]